MRYLLDASALVELFLRLNAKELMDLLQKCYILDLTVYEFCNALWKLAKIKKLIDKKTAIIGAKLIKKILAAEIIKTMHHDDLENVMRGALDHNVNIYDLSYIITAKNQNMVLVTSDNGMYINAKDVFKVATIKTDAFLEAYTKRGNRNSNTN